MLTIDVFYRLLPKIATEAPCVDLRDNFLRMTWNFEGGSIQFDFRRDDRGATCVGSLAFVAVLDAEQRGIGSFFSDDWDVIDGAMRALVARRLSGAVVAALSEHEARAAAWLRENEAALAAEATYIEAHGVPGSLLALHRPHTTEQDRARRLTEWAASPREGLPGWSGYDDEELPTDAD